MITGLKYSIKINLGCSIRVFHFSCIQYYVQWSHITLTLRSSENSESTYIYETPLHHVNSHDVLQYTSVLNVGRSISISKTTIANWLQYVVKYYCLWNIVFCQILLKTSITIAHYKLLYNAKKAVVI